MRRRTGGAAGRLARVCIGAMALAMASSARAADYYVDGQNPKASDQNAGTEAAPWKTLQQAAKVASAGDVVRVLPGVYAGTMAPAHSGSADKPLVFRAVADGLPPEGQVVIEGGSPGVDLRKRQYVRLEGFEIRKTTGRDGHGVAMDEGDHLEVVGCHIHDTAGSGVIVQKGSDCIVRECYIHNLGELGIHAGGLTMRVKNCQFLRNHIHDNAVEDGIQIGSGDDCTMAWNYIHDIWAPPPSHTDGIQLHSDNRNYRIIGNVIHRIRDEGFMIGAEGTDKAKGSPPSAPLYEENIMSDGGGVGFILSHGVRNAILRHNTIMWGRDQAVWIHNNSTGTTVVGNLFQCPVGGCIVTSDSKEGLKVEYNLTASSKGEMGEHGVRGEAKLADPKQAGSATLPNARLLPGSPAIGAGPEGSSIGALEYPNVYYVDAAHPAATDSFYGYQALPFKTLAKAVATAKPGETILLRAGVYREVLAPKAAGVTIKAAKGEKVVLSGADLITGWKRQEDKWAAPLAAKPVKVLKDGKPFTEFAYDEAGKSLVVSGFDPRLSRMETVVRSSAIDLSAAPGMKIEGVETADTSGPPIVGGAK
jgi:hypothetical protein